jgi:SNF2 family DNA or RNA helicase
MEVGLAIIRTTMAHVALRRSKAHVGNTIQLVEKTVEIRKIIFPEDSPHKPVHDALFQSARQVFLGLLRLGVNDVLDNYMQLLELLLRVRQSCCHAELVPLCRRESAFEIFDQIQKAGPQGLDPYLAEELLQKLRRTFADNQLEECVVCMDQLNEEDAVILRDCKHIFCSTCLNQIQNHCCPMCRKEYTPDDMIKKKDAQQAAKIDKKPAAKKSVFGTKMSKLGRAPKIQAMLNAIDEMSSDEKCVIFSQWTSYLDIIEAGMSTIDGL